MIMQTQLHRVMQTHNLDYQIFSLIYVRCKILNMNTRHKNTIKNLLLCVYAVRPFLDKHRLLGLNHDV